MAHDDEGLLDYDAAAKLTGIRRGTLASMVSRRQVPHLRIGRRLVRFDRAELRAWLDERRVPVQRALRAGAPQRGDHGDAR